MKKASNIVRPAGSAIAIALAIASSPSIAQDAADPVPVVVATMPSTVTESPPPAIVVPEIASVVSPEITPEQTSPDVAAASSDPNVRTSRNGAMTRSAPPPTRVAADLSSNSPGASRISDPAGGATATAGDSSVVTNQPVERSAAQAVAPVESGDHSDTSLALVGGALALALGLGGLALVAVRRRRRPAAESDSRLEFAPISPATDVVDRVEPVAAAPLAAGRAFSLTQTVSRPFGISKWDDPLYVNAPAIAVAGRSVPDTPAGRKALIDRLVRANPDRANPFRSSSARRRRARLIVQSLRQTMAQQPNIDFRRFYESFGQRKASFA